MAISRLFGPRRPDRMLTDVKSVEGIPDKAFESLVRHAEEVVLMGQAYSAVTTAKVAEDAGIKEAQLTTMVRVYSNLRLAFLAEPSADKFQEELVQMGISRKKAQLLWKSYSSNRQKIEYQLNPALRGQFGPTISVIRWRIDKPVEGTPPLILEPVGVVSLVLNTPTETIDQRIEVDIVALDNLIEELTTMRQTLAKLQPSSKVKDKAD